jgi:hypothetical protein
MFISVAVLLLATNPVLVNGTRWECNVAAAVPEANSAAHDGQTPINTEIRLMFGFQYCSSKLVHDFAAQPSILIYWLRELKERNELCSLTTTLDEALLRDKSLDATLRTHAAAMFSGCGGLQRGRDSGINPSSFLRTIADDWDRADGEYRSWISDDLLLCLALFPSDTLRFLARHQSITDNWLKNLQDSSFNGSPDLRNDKEIFRTNLIARLVSIHSKEDDALRRNIVRKLKKTKYHTIGDL